MATELAAYYVSIIPSAKGIKGNLTREFATADVAAGEAGTRQARRFSGKFKAALIGAGLGSGLALLFRTGFREAADASAGVAQLNAGIKSTGNAANVTTGSLTALAASVQSYSGQTDDSIVQAESLLLTFTKIRNNGPDKIFDQATVAAADMAARFGGDASSNARLLGKALNDPIRGLTALTRVGVSFTAGQKKQITALVKSGKTVKAQKLILAELNKEFGGSARAAGQSLPGKLARAKRAFEDLAQKIAERLIPTLLKVADFIQKRVLPAVDAVVGFISRNKTAFTIAAAVIGTIVIALKAWAIAQAVINFLLTANPIGLIVIALAALAAGLFVAYKKSETFRDIVRGVFAVIKTYITVWWTVVKTIFLAFIAVGKGLGSGLKWAYDNVIKPIFRLIRSAVRTAASFLRGAVKVISDLWNGIGDGLKWAYDHTIKPILDLIMGAVHAVQTVINALVGGPHADLSKTPAKNVGTQGGQVGGGFHRAMGGPVTKGRPYIVGEKRPELFVPEQNGRIVPRIPSGLLGDPGRAPDANSNTLNVYYPLPERTSDALPRLMRTRANALAA